ncbi:hypothetical protein GEMRC1_014091 [Eukaryota sp. GEM-RC1]
MLSSRYFPSFIAKSEVKSIPFIGKISKALNCLFVNRSDQYSRSLVADSIAARMSDPTSSSLCLFPQGCTSDSRYITSFQLGAFRPGLPVLPVVFDYQYKRANCSWDTRHFLLLYYRTSCQIVNRVVVYYLPVYHPSEEEVLDPVLFADNVRKLMAKVSGLKLSSSGYRAKRLYEEVIAEKITLEEANLILEKSLSKV